MRKKNIYLLPFMLLCIWGTIASAQQKRTIAGIVKDSSGNTIPGISVNVKGTKASAATDAQGNFKISVTAANSILVLQVSAISQKKSGLVLPNE